MGDNRISMNSSDSLVSDSTPDMGVWQRGIILENVAKDPHYVPYCMRCQGLVRMRAIERHYWRCACGASCDYRQAKTDRGDSP